ncbi:hypothetical protein [Nostoc sp. DedSLP04]|uniref:hypothetical protein n=1 Tax=Nostoc sp. DedSLP04 TaxID=3075401 RepID=UPI002AD40C2C|nr:hypothetical protein [Nostoc sp. DedSLP04]MDZ8030703.1 hypothetical protein [Nostoc sp. DedSLP04]
MSEILSNIDNKKKLEFFKKIKGIEEKLYEIDIESKFINPKQKEEFKEYRQKWTSCVNKVRNKIGTILVNKLEENEKGFEDGIKAINQEIQEINNAVGFLNIFSKTIEIIENIVGLVI